IRHTLGPPVAEAAQGYFLSSMIKPIGSVVIRNCGIVKHPVASAVASPRDAPKRQCTMSPGANCNFCSLRMVTSTVVSDGTLKLVLSSDDLTRNNVVSTASGVSRTCFHRRNALIWPDFLSATWSGHGSGSFVDALVNTG